MCTGLTGGCGLPLVPLPGAGTPSVHLGGSRRPGAASCRCRPVTEAKDGWVPYGSFRNALRVVRVRSFYAVHVEMLDRQSAREADGTLPPCHVCARQIRWALLGGRRGCKGLEPYGASVTCAVCGKPIEQCSDLRAILRRTSEGAALAGCANVRHLTTASQATHPAKGLLRLIRSGRTRDAASLSPHRWWCRIEGIGGRTVTRLGRTDGYAPASAEQHGWCSDDFGVRLNWLGTAEGPAPSRH